MGGTPTGMQWPSQNQHLANWSRFRPAWDRMRNSTQALALADGPAPPPPVLGANVPPPGDGEHSSAVASDAARFRLTPLNLETQEEVEAGPAPPPTAGSTTGGVFQRRHLKQDALASEDRLVARMDQYRQTCTKPSSPVTLCFGKDWARFKRSIVWLWRTSWGPATLAVVAVPSQPIYRRPNFNLEGFKLTNFEFRGLIDATADNVYRDNCRFLGCSEHDDVAGNDLANLSVSTHRAGLMKQLFFSHL